ncbi:hypothetical protein PENSPDRAFT_304591 [Peniophora sp. CONT]|nr:hypothetical protein PENSPDRAFT_304591 [Peniophora sp. CONT]
MVSLSAVRSRADNDRVDRAWSSPSTPLSKPTLPLRCFLGTSPPHYALCGCVWLFICFFFSFLLSFSTRTGARRMDVGRPASGKRYNCTDYGRVWIFASADGSGSGFRMRTNNSRVKYEDRLVILLFPLVMSLWVRRWRGIR